MNGTSGSFILNLVIFLPLLVAGLVALLPSEEKSQIRGVAFGGTVLSLLTTLWAWSQYDVGSPVEFQLAFRHEWVRDIGLSYHVGVDGLSLTLVMVTGFMAPLVMLSSWGQIDTRVKEFHVALLVLQAATYGSFVAVDTLLFFVFFEVTLIPLFMLIGVWGSEDRTRAAIKFFIFTMTGSLLMMISLLGVYFLAAPAGERSFDFPVLYEGLVGASRELAAYLNQHPGGDGAGLSPSALALYRYGPWLFAGFAIAFAVKVPMFPFHTWLPDALVQAPIAAAIMLELLKVGTYGFWRFAVPFFPVQAQQYQTLFATLAVVGIVYGALMSLVQRDIKKLLAYASVSHLGYCMLGIFAFTTEGATGSAYQMLSHAVSTGALFLLFGFLYQRRNGRLMSDYGGIAKVMPRFSTLFVIVVFSSIAVPGTNGFVAEFLVLMGTFKSQLPVGFGVVAATSVVLGAAYMLWMVQKVFFGPVTHAENHTLKDLSTREMATAVPFVIVIIIMGLRPQPVLDVLNTSSARLVARVKTAPVGKTVAKPALAALPTVQP